MDSINKKEFHLRFLITAAKGLLLSEKSIDEASNILSFMVGESLLTSELPRVADECTPFLFEQFPFLDTPELDFAIAEFREMLKSKSGSANPEELAIGWLSRQVQKYGEMFSVESLPKGIHKDVDVLSEIAQKMGGKDKIIPVLAS